jgi:hypothetical protein
MKSKYPELGKAIEQVQSADQGSLSQNSESADQMRLDLRKGDEPVMSIQFGNDSSSQAQLINADNSANYEIDSIKVNDDPSPLAENDSVREVMIALKETQPQQQQFQSESKVIHAFMQITGDVQPQAEEKTPQIESKSPPPNANPKIESANPKKSDDKSEKTAWWKIF